MVEYQNQLNEFVMEVIDIIANHGKLSEEGKLRSQKLRENAVRFIIKQEEEKRKQVSCLS